ncbi:MAG: hypothetical protein AB7P03_03470 [Kofleriaceae bacterium]
MRLGGLLVVLAAVAMPALSLADGNNRNYLPFGERAAMLGNAGFTSPEGEAVYYNPANLARINYPSLSVSGSTYLVYEVGFDPLIHLEGVDQPFSASGFVAIPSSLVSTYQIGSWSLATAILVPEAFAMKNRETLTFNETTTTMLQDLQVQSMWLGAGIAREVAPGWSIGISGFVARETRSDIQIFEVKSAIVGVSQRSESSDTSIMNLMGIVGVQWQPSRSFGVGLRVQPPSLRLSGTKQVWASSIAVDPMGVMTTDGYSIDDVPVGQPLPTDIGLGVSVRPHPGAELMIDVGLQLPTSFVAQADPMLGVVTEKLELAPRVGLGAEIEVGSSMLLRLGAMYNRSAAVGLDDGGPGKEDYFGATAGFSMRRGRTITSIGVFGMQSNPEYEIVGSDPARRSFATMRMYGGLLAVSYRL